MKALQCPSLASDLSRSEVKNLCSGTGQAHPDGDKLTWLLRQLADTAPAWGFPSLVEQEQCRLAAAPHPFLQLPTKMFTGKLSSKRAKWELRSCL